MGRKRYTVSDEQLVGDPRYDSRLVSKFINCLMLDGKKSTAHRVFYDAMDRISQKIKDVPPIDVFETAIDNVRPEVEVRSKRIGGANYQVPHRVEARRAQSLAIRWILQAVRGKKTGKSITDRLFSEISAAYNGEGDAMNTRENVHRMAAANKAFAHFGN